MVGVRGSEVMVSFSAFMIFKRELSSRASDVMLNSDCYSLYRYAIRKQRVVMCCRPFLFVTDVVSVVHIL